MILCDKFCSFAPWSSSWCAGAELLFAWLVVWFAVKLSPLLGPWIAVTVVMLVTGPTSTLPRIIFGLVGLLSSWSSCKANPATWGPSGVEGVVGPAAAAASAWFLIGLSVVTWLWLPNGISVMWSWRANGRTAVGWSWLAAGISVGLFRWFSWPGASSRLTRRGRGAQLASPGLLRVWQLLSHPSPLCRRGPPGDFARAGGADLNSC